MMALYTLGYAAFGSDQELARLMADPRMLLIDIRFLPVSRWRPQWRKAALSAAYGRRYKHMRGLGNMNYKHRDRGIQLYDPDASLRQLRVWMREGYSLVLLCACSNYEQCHRRLVYDLLTQQQEGAKHDIR
jgi:uncharacterized protein (DUF488 family)